jgi:hypothetical protein
VTKNAWFSFRLLSARPDLELVFLQEMISAWHSSQHLKLGLFSDAEADWCPLAPDEISKNAMRPFKPENIETHDLWIRFIQVCYNDLASKVA